MIVKLLKRLANDRKGGTAIEYGLIVSVVVIVMIVAFIELAQTTTGIWGNVNDKILVARTGG